ncbi:MAG: CRISPR-associated helicase Cas3' [Planctomycetia bacterium]|nr:CRISPR-associated helicase Cas3' [Planctomycetia bacterium]
MLDTLWGHSGQEGGSGQPLEAHLAGVAEFVEAFGAGTFGKVAAWLHDFGKADTEFQKYLWKASQNREKRFRCAINHSEAGAALAVQLFGEEKGKVLAYLILGHHAGLPDYLGGPASLQSRLKTGKKNLERIEKYAEELQSRLPKVESLVPKGFLLARDNYHLWIRMLFSCLVDADWLDTERFMAPDRFASRPVFPTIQELKSRFDKHRNQPCFVNLKEGATEKEKMLKASRDAVLAACRREGRAERSHGIYQLAVPTGGGKTLSSMAFALEHAVRHGKKRILYVIPYTSIIEQTADVFREIFGTANIVEHHSNLDVTLRKEKLQKEGEDTDPITSEQLDLAAENWDAPLILTTSVQFFESLFSARPSRCRKVHNIADSVVILDEVQTLPPNLLHPLVSVMNALSWSFGTTFVLCSATQPALESLKMDQPFPIVSETETLYQNLRRVKFHVEIDSPRTWPDLADELARQKQVLCIVNTRRDCYELFQELESRSVENVVPLSALMCGQHRSEVIAKIRADLSDGQPVRVVSTQLVEAGVDLDFPTVYRCLAGLDSLLQAAGRCNREGKLEYGDVFVFAVPKPVNQGLIAKGAGACRELLTKKDFDLQKYASYSQYSELFYAMVNDMGSALQKSLTADTPDVPFREVDEKFRMIDDDCSEAVVVRYGESPKWIDALKADGVSREILRKLQRYTINLPRNVVANLCDNGLLEKLDSGLMVQKVEELYDDKVGMDIFSGKSKMPTIII